MLRVGVIGVGGMGRTHLEAYAKVEGVRVVAVADASEVRRAAGVADVRQYDDGLQLMADPDIDLVDICVPTPLHVPFSKIALAAGKHVLCEKPLALTSAEADDLVAAADAAQGVYMNALCMRFWPAWAWLKEAIEQQRHGRVLAAHFRRVASHPGLAYCRDGETCGGGILDLHVHDTDFVQYCFGLPDAVFSRGYAKPTSRIDHVTTHFLYPDVPIVTAEGGWAMASGFAFTMQYTVNFAHATAVFDSGAEEQLKLIADGHATPVAVAEGLGYEHEIRYLAGCIARGEQPTKADAASAARSVKLVEAEVASIACGQPVRVST